MRCTDFDEVVKLDVAATLDVYLERYSDPCSKTVKVVLRKKERVREMPTSSLMLGEK